MKVADDGKSINVTEQEAIKLATLGFVFVCEFDGKIIAIIPRDKVEGENNGNN